MLFVVALPLALVAAAVAVLAWIGSERAIHPHAGPPEYDAAGHGLSVEPVRFAAADGTRLAGWYAPGSRAGGVVLAHGYGSRREEMLPHARFLHDAGYAVLLFDFRHSGESEGRAVTIGALERLDVLGAVRELRARDATGKGPIFVLGVSMGAAAALLAAAESEEISAVVAEGAYRSVQGVVAQSFRHFIGLPPFPCAPLTVWLVERKVGFRARNLRPEIAVTRLGTRRLLLIHGLSDERIDPEHSRALATAYPAAELWLVADAPHARAYQTAPDQYRERVLAFLEAAGAPHQSGTAASLV